MAISAAMISGFMRDDNPQQMRKKLERLQKQVQDGKAEVEKWNIAEFKNKSVKARVEELISKTEKFNWD